MIRKIFLSSIAIPLIAIVVFLIVLTAPHIQIQPITPPVKDVASVLWVLRSTDVFLLAFLVLSAAICILSLIRDENR